MEKTFEELIDGLTNNIDNISYIATADVMELLKQVREATINEIAENFSSEDWALFRFIEDMKTDRILITENEE